MTPAIEAGLNAISTKSNNINPIENSKLVPLQSISRLEMLDKVMEWPFCSTYLVERMIPLMMNNLGINTLIYKIFKYEITWDDERNISLLCNFSIWAFRTFVFPNGSLNLNFISYALMQRTIHFTLKVLNGEIT